MTDWVQAKVEKGSKAEERKREEVARSFTASQLSVCSFQVISRCSVITSLPDLSLENIWDWK